MLHTSCLFHHSLARHSIRGPPRTVGPFPHSWQRRGIDLSWGHRSKWEKCQPWWPSLWSGLPPPRQVPVPQSRNHCPGPLPARWSFTNNRNWDTSGQNILTSLKLCGEIISFARGESWTFCWNFSIHRPSSPHSPRLENPNRPWRNKPLQWGQPFLWWPPAPTLAQCSTCEMYTLFFFVLWRLSKGFDLEDNGNLLLESTWGNESAIRFPEGFDYRFSSSCGSCSQLSALRPVSLGLGLSRTLPFTHTPARSLLQSQSPLSMPTYVLS